MNTAWFRWLVLLSLGFVLAALVHGDYLDTPDVANPARLAGSVVLLIGGFVLQAAAWFSVVRRAGLDTDFAACLAGSGLCVFAKYVPGKVAVILGRALYLAEHRRLPGAQLTALSLHAQLLALWTAMLLGAPGVALAGAAAGSWGGLWIGMLAVGVVFAALSVVIFANVAPGSVSWLAQRFAGRTLALPRFEVGATLAVLPIFLAQWIVWGIAFALFADALAPGSGGVAVALAFPMSVAFGIVVVFAPGGLGVQEGALAAVLLMTGMEAGTAATVAVASRLWWLAGEACLFLIGGVAHRR